MGNSTSSRSTPATNIEVTLPSVELNMTNMTAMGRSLNLPNLKLFMVFIYSVMSLAIFFNFRVIYIVLRAMSKRQVNKSSRHGPSGAGNQHVFVYVLSLSVVDSFVLAHLPFVATDIITGWIFGTFLCKLFYMIEQVNRILSTFILTALSGDRYLAVCQPLRFRQLRTTKAAVCFIIISVVVAGISLTPTYIYSTIVEFHYNNRSIHKCSFDLTSEMADRFLIYIFVCGYCIPFVSMVFFYSSILHSLWKKNSGGASSETVAEAGSRAQRSQKRARHVTQKALTLVLFYFGCWTPYWCVQFIVEFFMDPDNPSLSHDAVFVAMYVVHILTYLNSAVNPFLYALLNKELQQQHSTSSATSLHTPSTQQSNLRGLRCEQKPLTNGNRAYKRGEKNPSWLITRCFGDKRDVVERDPNEMPLLTQSARSNYSAAQENRQQ